MNIINVLGIRRLLKMQKAHNLALKYVRGFMVTECLCALSKTGIAGDLLQNKELEIGAYAKNKNLDERALRAVFNYLYALRIMDKSNDAYRLSGQGRLIMEDAKGPFDFAAAYSPVFSGLGALLAKSEKYGVEIKRIDSLVGKASAETEKWIPYPVVQELIKKYKFKAILDLGCGSADFLIELCRNNPALLGFGIDISQAVIEGAGKGLEALEVKSRVELRQCDIFALNTLPEEWAQKVDVITCMFVLHEFAGAGNTAKIISLLRQIKGQFRNSSIIICELCRNSPESLRRNPSLIAEHHLFHALSNQEVLSYAEWQKVFAQVPLKIVEEFRFIPAGQAYFILS